ncbi:MAG TPA: helix-turn-helix domain-containing protein [Anaerolineae bacterium]|nr:helix-turn-helix domain-containing protein [Anaerolineae bacterium]HUW13367.1 helix-turn-helix domain-containing protein [Anaerolineae bacterium]
MDDSLHPRQQAILGFVDSYVAQKGYAPSLREICQALDIPSKSTVTYHLNALQRRGLIHRDPGISRSLSVPGTQGISVGESQPSRSSAANQTSQGGPRTRAIVRRILELGERLEEPQKGQLVIDFAGLTVKIRITVVVPGDP